METKEIIERSKELNFKLHRALATMERKSNIFDLKTELIGIQNQCKHIDHNYNWDIIDGHCPYCGKKLFNS